MGPTDNNQPSRQRQAEMRPTPRSAGMGFMADALTAGRNFADRAQIPEAVPLLGGQSLGQLLLGKAPEELNEWSYGNAPMRVNPLAGRTAGYMPEMKPGRQQGAADLLALAPLPGARGALVAGAGGMIDTGMSQAALSGVSRAPKRISTVVNPERVSFPGIYDNPRELVGRAQVAPEDAAMKRLFGVTREDLFNISEQGTRQGNLTGVPYKTAANPRGSDYGSQLTAPKNTQRILDIIGEAKARPDLFNGMASWYTMDPLFDQFKRLYGDAAPQEYDRFNTFLGMASPGSEVLTEIPRGTAANWLEKSGRWEDFMNLGEMSKGKMPKPADMADIPGHVYHSTSQAIPMDKYVKGGSVDMDSAKVPSYIQASGVPETGFQTDYPVGDAHWSRLVGLADVRGAKTLKGKEVIPGASATVPEMVSLTPWWQKKVAAEAGLQSVPAQAVVWGAGANATGVTSPIGAPKLELLAQQIMKAARRMGVSPEKARDMIITGKAHAGAADPQLLQAIAAAGGAAALGNMVFSREEGQ